MEMLKKCKDDIMKFVKIVEEKEVNSERVKLTLKKM